MLLFTPFTVTWSKCIPNHLRWWHFAPYVSGFCHIHGKTPRGILPANSNQFINNNVSGQNKVFKSCNNRGIIILKLQHDDAPFKFVCPTNKIAHFAEVSLYFILSSTTSWIRKVHTWKLMRLRLAVMTRIENCQPRVFCINENRKFTESSQNN